MASVEDTFRVRATGAGAPIWKYLLYRRHMFAYEYAQNRDTRWRVGLDIACGFGYALEKLAEDYDRVIAVDLARTPLLEVGRYEAVDRVQCDAAALPIASDSVDLALAFQLIEHVEPESAVRIMREMYRVLSPGGCALLTTPNARWRLLRGQKPWNPYHVIEYRPSSIVKLCRRSGLPGVRVKGVIGLNGAHEIEVGRVKQDVLVRRLGKVGRTLRRLAGRSGMKGHAQAKRERQRPATAHDEAERWFEATDDIERGLDFLIEIRKGTA